MSDSKMWVYLEIQGKRHWVWISKLALSISEVTSMASLLGLTLGARLHTVICPKHLWRGYRIRETLKTIKACMEESTKQR